MPGSADTSRAAAAPAVAGITETAMYADDLVAAERFYGGVLGLSRLGGDLQRDLFYAVGPRNVLLVFQAAATLRGESLPAHGTTGSGHFALGIAAQDLPRWRNHLTDRGVAIEREVTWPRGGQSLYFRDPAGNLVELATPGIWGLPEGW